MQSASTLNESPGSLGCSSGEPRTKQHFLTSPSTRLRLCGRLIAWQASQGDARAPLHALQFRAHPQDAPRDASDGGGKGRSRLELGGDRGACGLRREGAWVNVTPIRLIVT